VPDVHHQYRQPGIDRTAGVVVVDAEFIKKSAEQTDVGAAVDLPDGADDVPWDQQRQGDGYQHQ
jgi:hypothetical protein